MAYLNGFLTQSKGRGRFRPGSRQIPPPPRRGHLPPFLVLTPSAVFATLRHPSQRALCHRTFVTRSLKNARYWDGFGAVLAAVLAGCGKSDGTGPTTTTSGSNATAAAPAVVQDPATLEARPLPPMKFLDAVRTGDDEKAAGLLSTVPARKPLPMNRSVTPPPDTARLHGSARSTMSARTGARVCPRGPTSTGNSSPDSETYVWVLRRSRRVGSGRPSRKNLSRPGPGGLGTSKTRRTWPATAMVREEIRRRKDQETMAGSGLRKSRKQIIR